MALSKLAPSMTFIAEVMNMEIYTHEVLTTRNHDLMSMRVLQLAQPMTFSDFFRSDVRDVYEQLVRRAKAKGKDNKKGGKMIKGSGNGELPISWTGTAQGELAEPLAATWGNGDDAKARHEAIVREYGNSIKKAKSAQIEHAAHPGGTDPNEKDHITVQYFDKNGGIIKDKNDWDSHHVYTNREKEVDLKPLIPPSLKANKYHMIFSDIVIYFQACSSRWHKHGSHR
ncbi:hypothetical protein C8Q75DRAFT_809767 [Abortiporus biennis]|nr:hypothetical protein C8Q75DRAFT_809767 [Abortiporus biennis]